MDKPFSDMIRACVSMQYATLELLDGQTDEKSVTRVMVQAHNQMAECIAEFRKGRQKRAA